jgi:hypothetical protein
VHVKGTPAVRLKDLVEALRVRIDRRELRVVRCKNASGPGVAWRIDVEPAGEDALLLVLEGSGLSARRKVRTRELHRQEILQLVALTGAEAIRPSIEMLLGEVDIVQPSPGKPEKLEEPGSVRPKPRTRPEDDIAAKPPPPAPLPAQRWIWRTGLVLGPRLGIQQGELVGYLAIRGAVSLGPMSLVAHLGAQNLPGADLEPGTVEAWAIEAGVGAAWEWRFLRLLLQVQNRFSIVELSGLDEPDRQTTFWNVGLGLAVDVTLWRPGRWELGLSAQGWFWPQPNRFLVRGEHAVTHSFVELFIGPMVSAGF